MIDSNNLGSLIGATAYDRDGDKIGRVGQVYVDQDTNQPSWASVSTGFFGTSESFVPLQGGDIVDGDLRVAYQKAQVKDAPRVDADGALSEQDEDELYRFYGLEGAAAGTTDVDHGAADIDRDATDVDRGTVGHDTSGPTTDNAMTRSEEQLHVGTERVETGRARLRKHVVTENQTVTVPVSHEEVRLEREPITDANAGDALDGPGISEEEHEVVLTEERPVVQKETVPVERVRLDTDTVTEEARVNEEVRKEQIELDGDDTRGRDRL